MASTLGIAGRLAAAFIQSKLTPLFILASMALGALAVVALRIGYFSPHRPDPDTVPAWELAAWLSARDAAELVRATVETGGLTFIVANGISANRYRRADLRDTIEQLGYQPVDDAWSS